MIRPVGDLSDTCMMCGRERAEGKEWFGGRGEERGGGRGGMKESSERGGARGEKAKSEEKR